MLSSVESTFRYGIRKDGHVVDNEPNGYLWPIVPNAGVFADIRTEDLNPGKCSKDTLD